MRTRAVADDIMVQAQRLCQISRNKEVTKLAESLASDLAALDLPKLVEKHERRGALLNRIQMNRHARNVGRKRAARRSRQEVPMLHVEFSTYERPSVFNFLSRLLRAA